MCETVWRLLEYAAFTGGLVLKGNTLWYTWYSVVIICYVVVQFAIFKPLGYCFEEAMEFGVRVSFAGRPVSRLVG